MSKHPAKKQPRTKPKQRPRAKVKAVRAWACVDRNGRIERMFDGTPFLWPLRKKAKQGTDLTAISVLISPLPRSRK